ncbi:hypothetical protein BH24ACT5_BH24ACT5_17610 [soil metagenome]
MHEVGTARQQGEQPIGVGPVGWFSQHHAVDVEHGVGAEDHDPVAHVRADVYGLADRQSAGQLDRSLARSGRLVDVG